MTLNEYFDTTTGTGILATADSSGKVDAAVYSRPHFIDDGSIVFIMRDRLTHHNLQSNPYAHFLFIEEGGRSRGRRLFLKKLREDQDQQLIDRFRRRPPKTGDTEMLFVVYFQLEKELPLLGSGEEDLHRPAATDS